MMNHLKDAELLQSLDGELPRKREAQVREHLASCWICSARLHDLEGTIDSFVYVHVQEHKSQIPDIEGPRALLRARIAAVESEVRTSHFSSFLNSIFQWRAATWAAAVLLLFAATTFFLARRTEPASSNAAEILRKAEQTEQIALSSKKRPVTFQRIRIQVSGRQYERTVYIDKKGSRSVSQLQPVAGNTATVSESGKVLAPVERALKESSLDWKEPLSPTHFKGWHAALGVRTDFVKKEPTITEVVTSTSEGSILEARVRFRNTDFHPISEALTLRNNVRVEIAELDYRVLELDDVRAEIFERAAPVRIPVPLGTPTLSTPLNASVGLELDVLEKLDSVGTFLGDQLSVERTEHAVSITGVVDNQQRKNEILRALGPLKNDPAVAVSVVLPRKNAEQRKQDVETPVVGVEKFDRAPADSRLREFFAAKGTNKVSEEALERFTADVSIHSQSARSHALALSQIAQSFTAEQLKEMTPSEHRQWRRLLETHAVTVLNETRSMRENLEPIFRTNVEDKRQSVGSVSGDAELINAARKLLDVTASNDKAVWNSFAASAQASEVVVVCTPEFWDSLLDAEILAQEISAGALKEY